MIPSFFALLALGLYGCGACGSEGDRRALTRGSEEESTSPLAGEGDSQESRIDSAETGRQGAASTETAQETEETTAAGEDASSTDASSTDANSAEADSAEEEAPTFPEGALETGKWHQIGAGLDIVDSSLDVLKPVSPEAAISIYSLFEGDLRGTLRALQEAAELLIGYGDDRPNRPLEAADVLDALRPRYIDASHFGPLPQSLLWDHEREIDIVVEMFRMRALQDCGDGAFDAGLARLHSLFPISGEDYLVPTTIAICYRDQARTITGTDTASNVWRFVGFHNADFYFDLGNKWRESGSRRYVGEVRDR